MRYLLLGIGNDILRDDGIGIYVAREVKERLKHKDLDIIEGLWGGFTLLDIISHYGKVLIIDGVIDENHKIGDVFWIDIDKLKDHRGFEQSHNIHLPTLLNVGERLGYRMPEVIKVLGISISEQTEFGGYDDMTESVRNAIPIASDIAIETLSSWLVI
ncbi:MAG: hydrogenase maturation protease [bacterium]